MKKPYPFDTHTTKDERKHELFFDSQNKKCWAVSLPPPPIPITGVGKIGRELKAESEEEARKKLISELAQGTY